MRARNSLSAVISVLVMGVAACATAPPVMLDADFETALVTSTIEADPFASIGRLNLLVANPALSPSQKAVALKARAKARIGAGLDKPAALADLENAGFLDQNDADGLIKVLTADIRDHEARLVGLQSQDLWFEDMAALGRLDMIAQRYQSSMLMPNAQQLYVLEFGGYVCTEEEDGGAPIYTHGEPPAHLAGKFWCPTEPKS